MSRKHSKAENGPTYNPKAEDRALTLLENAALALMELERTLAESDSPHEATIGLIAETVDVAVYELRCGQEARLAAKWGHGPQNPVPVQ
jgi:hypothetical protein